MKKILITGGHFTPGLALIKHLQKKDWEIHWVGIEHSITGHTARSLEAKILPELGIPFWKISTGKFHRHSLLLNLVNFWKIPFGFLQSLIIVNRINPDIVLSFGSYVSVPVATAAYLKGIPIILHEQTAASGLANRIVGRFAQKIALSFPESKTYFPSEKCVVTGNLVRERFFEIARIRKKRKKNHPIGTRPLIYITGGSRGSRSINWAIWRSLPRLLAKYEVFHQTGQIDYEHAVTRKKSLTKNSQFYSIFANLTLLQVEEVFLRADLIVSRAGANTVSEIAVAGVPAILIPISWSESDEQTKNAQALVRVGIATLLPEAKLSKRRNRLYKTIKKMFANLENYTRNIARAQKLVPQDAAERLAELIKSEAR